MVLLPTRSWYAAGTPVHVEVRSASGHPPAGSESGWRLDVLELGRRVHAVAVDRPGTVELGALPTGCYGLDLRDAADASLTRTAVQVLEPDQVRTRLRYGFVTDYRPDRDTDGLADLVRRLHLTAIQCYDWAFRHADPLGGGESYTDPLGRRVDLGTVRRLVAACHRVGADALGYAAVYGVGAEQWPRWSHRALLDHEGRAHRLGEDFLRIVDPAAPDWLAHLVAALAAATETVGFDGFHLDQYGWPMLARTPDGAVVDVAASFTTMLAAARRRLPAARLIFNNVNDFPTRATADAGQDAVYVEVWEPHDELGDLAALVQRSRAVAGTRPVVVAAYLTCFGTAPQTEALQAAALLMATLFSHGATNLLVGEEGRVLTDPYYPRNEAIDPAALDRLVRWHDFLVEHDDLLVAPAIVEVTGSHTGSYNGVLDVCYQDAPVSWHPRPGCVWRRVTRTGAGLVVHLVNLTGVDSVRWDHPQPPPGRTGAGSLRLALTGLADPDVWVADPDGSGHLQQVPVRTEGGLGRAVLPSLRTWQVVLVRSR